MKKQGLDTNTKLLEAIHEIAESVKALASLTDRQFKEQRKILEQHSQQLSSHTGTLAEILVMVKRLDDERLVEHHRLNQVIDDVKRLQEAH